MYSFTLACTVRLLRYSVALVFFLHALVRVFNGTIPRFADYLENKGFPFAMVIVWMITVFELLGGLLMAAGRNVMLWGIGFIILLLMGIVLIHFSRGWFVGEHGDGGVEYSFVLIMALLTIIASDVEKRKKNEA